MQEERAHKARKDEDVGGSRGRTLGAWVLLVEEEESDRLVGSDDSLASFFHFCRIFLFAVRVSLSFSTLFARTKVLLEEKRSDRERKTDFSYLKFE
mmetsp:Transcript_41650/g.82188  ORF Transcript_41650/g.82188 Transcript_41650/m.82188 type:complete len:96 (-) Transcript_41650:323-610(-)